MFVIYAFGGRFLLAMAIAYTAPSITTTAYATDGVVVSLAGELDLAHASRLGDVLASEIARGHRQLVIDLQRATFLDCATLGTLLRAVAPLREDPDSAVLLAGPTGIVLRLLLLLELEQVFEIVADVDTAVRLALQSRNSACRQG
jgi:anti-anti-sigma factor